METKNTPEKKFSTGTVTATIWQNQGRGRNGELVGYRTISLQRSYKDKKGVWHNTSSFRINDLPKAAVVLQKSYEFLVLREAGRIASEYNDSEIIEEVI